MAKLATLNLHIKECNGQYQQNSMTYKAIQMCTICKTMLKLTKTSLIQKLLVASQPIMMVALQHFM